MTGRLSLRRLTNRSLLDWDTVFCQINRWLRNHCSCLWLAEVLAWTGLRHRVTEDVVL